MRVRALLVVSGFLLVCGPPWRALAAARLTDYTGSRPVSAADVQDLTAYLRDAPDALRADFALAALTELVEVYSIEVARARAEPGGRSANPDLRRWVRAVEGMLDDLQGLLDTLTPETPVSVSTLHDGTVYLVVDGDPVLLSGPRPGENAALEHRVLQRFCSRNDCGELVDAFDAQISRTYTAGAQVSPVWRFGDAAGPVCATGDGLEFQFDDTQGLGEKRAACQRIVSELNVLAAALAEQVQAGIAPDWSRLAIRSTGSDSLQSVVVNAAGDTLLLPLPALAQTPEVFRLVLPWLAAKVDGRRYNLVVLHAGRFVTPPVQSPE